MKTRFNFPTKIIFGESVVEDIPAELKTLNCKKPLIITDKGLMGIGIPQRIGSILTKAGINYSLFSEVIPNPTDEEVRKATDLYNTTGSDCIIAVGGGSSMDTGKAVQIAINHHEPLEIYDDLKGGDRLITGAIPPILAIPTTAGTGSEVSRSAVITVRAVDRKVVLFSPRLMPTVAVCDPELTYGLPPRITAETGMDALSHNLEAFLSKGYHPMADGIAISAISMVATNLIAAVKNGNDAFARRQMMMASTMGAVAFQKGLGVIHSLAHPLSSVCGVSHGLANSIMMPHAVRFNQNAAADRIPELAAALGSEELTAESAASTIEKIAIACGLPMTLSKAGVKEEQIPKLVEKAMEDGCHLSNPRPCTAENMEQLYREAM